MVPCLQGKASTSFQQGARLVPARRDKAFTSFLQGVTSSQQGVHMLPSRTGESGSCKASHGISRGRKGAPVPHGEAPSNVPGVTDKAVQGVTNRKA